MDEFDEVIRNTLPKNILTQEQFNEIKTLFNNGITLWHNPATFLDYSQNNTIV